MARPHETRPQPAVIGPAAQLADTLDDAVALGVRIEGRRGAQLHRELAAVLDRIDHDDLARSSDAASLHGSEADRPGAKDDDVRSGLETHVRVAGRKSRCQLVAEQGQLRRRQVGEHRHAVLLEGGHDLAHAADAGLRVDECAVQELRERRKRFDALRV